MKLEREIYRPEPVIPALWQVRQWTRRQIADLPTATIRRLLAELDEIRWPEVAVAMTRAKLQLALRERS